MEFKATHVLVHRATGKRADALMELSPGSGFYVTEEGLSRGIENAPRITDTMLPSFRIEPIGKTVTMTFGELEDWLGEHGMSLRVHEHDEDEKCWTAEITGYSAPIGEEVIGNGETLEAAILDAMSRYSS
jgi:hypothetical protein